MPAANVLTMTNDCGLLGKPLRRLPVKGLHYPATSQKRGPQNLPLKIACA
jgi:hypothetical protein